MRDAIVRRGGSWLLWACLLYVAVAGLWIIASDALLGLITDDPAVLTSLQTYKGWLFVVVSAALLYAVGRQAANLALVDSRLQADVPELPSRGNPITGLQRLIIAASILIVLVTLLLVSYGLGSERESILRQARQNAGNLAQVIETQTLHAVESTDFTLQSLIFSTADMPHGAEGGQEAILHRQLRQAAAALSHIRALFIVDERGRMVADSDSLPARRVDFSDREYFTVHRNNPDLGLFISAPIVSRTVGKPFIAVSRRLEKRAGGFDGVIVAALDTEYVQQLYSDLNVGKEGSVALFLRNGTLLVRAPHAGSEIGKSFADRPIFSDLLERSPRGIYRTSSAIDGISRIFGYRTVPGFPLVVLVGLGEQESLAGWRRTVRIEALAGLLFVLTIAILAYALIAQLRRREALATALSSGEERYRYLFDANPRPMWLRDIETRRLIDVNQAAVALYGYTREEFANMPPEALYLPEDIESQQAFIRQRGTEADSVSTWRHVRKDGSVMDVEVTSRFFVVDGRRARLSLLTDVTEKRRAEQSLRESEERYRYLFDCNPLPMWIYDFENLRFLAVNDAAVSTYGYSREEFLSMIILDIRPQEEVARIRERLKTLNQAENRSGIWTHRKKNGDIIHVDIVSHGLDFEGRRARLVLANDVSERVRIENALRDSELRYRELFELSPVPMWVYDTDSLQVLAVNDLAVEHYGYTREEFGMMSIPELYPAEDVPLLMDRIAQRVPGTLNRRLLRHRLKNGGVIEVETTSGPIVFDGHQARLVAISDVTQRRKTERALHESRQRLQTITDNVPALIAYVDADQCYRFVNKMHETWYGIPCEAYYGKTMREVLGDDRYEAWRFQIEAALSGKTVSVERQSRSATRELVARMTCLPDIGEQGKVEGIYILGYDITERKKAEEALARERTLLRQVIDNLPDHIYVKDRERRYLLINAPSMKARGIASHDEIAGRSTFDFYPPDLAAQYDAEDRSIMETGRTLVNREQFTVQRDGQKKWHLTTKVPMRDMHGEIIGIVGINRDITEIKQGQEVIRELNALLEQRVIERTAQLEAANKELESFAYSVSHDLRAPLRSIDGFSQALIEDYRDVLDQTGAGYLQRVRNASQRMAQLIDDLLELSRITRREMHRESTDFSMLAQEIIADLRKEHPERAVEVSIMPGIRLQADANLLRIALENLIRNAWKFTGKQPHARIEVGMQKREDGSVYFVRDNGAGFDMSYAGKLFGAFQRLHSEAEFPGTGIGLATVQRVVRRHGGSIWVEAAPGKGATFFFTIGAGVDC
jgi:PAS domain S-box-containing protein